MIKVRVKGLMNISLNQNLRGCSNNSQQRNKFLGKSEGELGPCSEQNTVEARRVQKLQLELDD